jgi:chemotaxis protein histidine kinase CheA
MLNLKTIADLIHAAETTVSEVIQANEDGNPVGGDIVEQLEEKINNIRKILLAELKQREAKSGGKGQQDPKAVFLKECFHTVRDMMESLYKDAWDVEKGRAAFRDLHTMKGSASMNNLGKVVDSIHVCETALDKAMNEMEQGADTADASMSEFKTLLESVQETITADLKTRMQASKSRKKGGASESQMLAENLASWLEGITQCADEDFHKKSFVDDVFREMHTNKGNAELLSMKALVSQIHACEELVTQWGDCLNAEGQPDAQVLTNLRNSMGNLITACKASSGPKKKEAAPKEEDLKMAS